MIKTLFNTSIIMFMSATCLFFIKGVEELRSSELRDTKLVREVSKNFMNLHPQIAAVEVWEYSRQSDEWFCILNSGKFNLCGLTPSYPDDEWSEATSLKIEIDGMVIKDLDGNIEFQKYVELIGVGYYFLKLDTPGGRRLTFVSKKPHPSKEVLAFVDRWGGHFDKI